MWPISAAFKTALDSSRAIVTKAELYDGATLLRTLNVESGSVSVGGSRAIRRECTVELADSSLVPVNFADILVPGKELKLYRGIRLATGDELVPLGVFRITTPQIDDSGDDLKISIKGYDRAYRVKRATLTSVYVIAAGTNYATAIHDLIDSRVSGLTYNFSTTARTTPGIVFDRGTDIWDQVRKMAEAIGHILFFDAAGVCTLKPEPNPTTDPIAFSYLEGATASILGVKRSLDEEKTYNHPIVTGEATTNAAPVFAEAKDLDPNSPTYINGIYGDVPYFFPSEFISTTAQAQEVADALLRRVKGLTEQLQFRAVPNPAHEAGDVVQVKRDRSKINANYVLESFSIPLGLGELNATVRERRV